MRLVVEGQEKTDRIGLEMKQDGADIDVFVNSDGDCELLIAFRLQDDKVTIVNYQVDNTRVIATGDDGKVRIQ